MKRKTEINKICGNIGFVQAVYVETCKPLLSSQQKRPICIIHAQDENKRTIKFPTNHGTWKKKKKNML